jgi:hypothetical protein
MVPILFFAPQSHTLLLSMAVIHALAGPIGIIVGVLALISIWKSGGTLQSAAPAILSIILGFLGVFIWSDVLAKTLPYPVMPIEQIDPLPFYNFHI